MGYPRLGIHFLIAICYPLFIVGQDVCVSKGPCICAFPNGTGIDLTPVSKSDFYIAQTFTQKSGEEYELSQYFYHPCYDAKPPVNNTPPTDTCNTNLTICRHKDTFKINGTNLYTKDAGINEYMGSTTNANFSSSGNSIIYYNLPSTTTVLLICSEGENKLHVYSEAEPNNIVLSFYSRSACVKKLNLPDEGGRSFGSTLLIVFFSLVIFYLVLGVCTKKFLMGATGVEVIPNLAFWTDLPNLVKDGWAFMVAGFKLPSRAGPGGPGITPSPNSYDSI